MRARFVSAVNTTAGMRADIMAAISMAAFYLLNEA
jgi:hypothetical protein